DRRCESRFTGSAPPVHSSLTIGRPGRLAHVTVGKYQPLPHPRIGGYGIQHAARPLTGGVQDHASIRRKTRRFVQASRRQIAPQSGPAEALIQQRNTINVTVSLRHSQLLAVAAKSDAGVVLALEGHPAGVTAACRDTVDLRLAATIRGEID